MRHWIATKPIAAALVAAWSISTLATPTAAQDAAPAPAEATTPSPPTEVRFDPGAMPEPSLPNEGLGLRYADLSPREVRSLRRGFKLPMEALATAQSVSALRQAVEVAPLPDPRQPFLAVKPVADGNMANPFTGSQVTSFRKDPMRALGQMLGAVAGEESAISSSPATNDPFGPNESPADTGPAEVSDFPADDATDDPFGTDSFDDPFGL